MNFLSGTWSGTISGTNVGTFTLELHDSAGQLTGLLSLTEPGAGLFVYDCTGEVNETRVTLRVSPRVVPDEAQASEGTARASIQPDGSLAGDWEMNRGTSGTFFARKQVLAQPVAGRGGSSATPAMAVSFEKSTRISSCVVDIDVLKRIYRELSTGSDEAARLELARQHQLAMAPASVGAPPQTPDYAQIRSHYSITILARGLNGEQIFSLDPGVLKEGHLPKPLGSIQFEIGRYYQLVHNSIPPNTALVWLDFTKPPLLDLTNPSYVPTPNDSILQVKGSDSMWVSGVYEKMAAILHHGQTKSGWIHSRYTYDALLFAIGLPAALAAASLASQTARTSLATQLAAFVFVALFSLAAFRLAFSAVKWLLPVVEFTGLPQPLHRQIRLALSTIVLGSVGSLGATLIWFVLYGNQ